MTLHPVISRRRALGRPVICPDCGGTGMALMPVCAVADIGNITQPMEPAMPTITLKLTVTRRRDDETAGRLTLSCVPSAHLDVDFSVSQPRREGADRR